LATSRNPGGIRDYKILNPEYRDWENRSGVASPSAEQGLRLAQSGGKTADLATLHGMAVAGMSGPDALLALANRYQSV